MSVTLRPQAVVDIDDIASHLEQNRTGYGLRFQQALEATLTMLERHPGIGTPTAVANPSLAGLRRRMVRGFKSYLIFYLSIPGGIEVIRVLYGARDLPTILAQDAP